MPFSLKLSAALGMVCISAVGSRAAVLYESHRFNNSDSYVLPEGSEPILQGGAGTFDEATLPGFDPSLGTLTGVTYGIDGWWKCGQGITWESPAYTGNGHYGQRYWLEAQVDGPYFSHPMGVGGLAPDENYTEDLEMAFSYSVTVDPSDFGRFVGGELYFDWYTESGTGTVSNGIIGLSDWNAHIEGECWVSYTYDPPVSGGSLQMKSFAAVPEPSGLLPLAIGAGALSRRRR